MPLDADAVRRGCRGAQVKTAHQLCRAEIERFRAAAASGDARSSSAAPRKRRCSPRSPASAPARSRFVNVRETAGWSADAATAGPKMAALLAAAAEPLPEIPFVSLDSEGVDPDLRPRRARDRGRQAAHGSSRRHRADRAPEGSDAAARHRFSGGARARSTPPRAISAPSRSWSTITPQPAPSSRGALAFGPARDGAVSRCDSCSISPAARRCSPRPICATAICAPIRAIPPPCCAPCSRRAISSAPSTSRATSPSPRISARIRARKIVGCHRCLDLCPTGAITPTGDHVAIDAKICAGCGQCAAACPTGAAAYALPPADALMRKLRALLTAYREAGGAQPDRAAARRGPRRAR